jgi:hypothetical protein
VLQRAAVTNKVECSSEDRANGWRRRGRKVAEGFGSVGLVKANRPRARIDAAAGADDGPRVAESH